MPASSKVVKTKENPQKRTKIADTAKALAAVKAIDFDCLKYTHEQLIELVELIFEEQGFLQEFGIPRQTLRRFLYQVKEKYNPNPYHNFSHCFDVFQASVFLLNHVDLAKKLSKLDRMCLMIAAIAHDLDHPGTNNAFQVMVSSELALLYNDKSPLENHHASLAFHIMKDPHCNLLQGLTEEQRKRARKLIIMVVLATDMADHGAHLKSFCSTFPVADKAPCDDFTFPANGEDELLKTLLKMSDISNVTRPFRVADKWAALVQEEFFYQGDTEVALGHSPAAMFDRRKADGPASNGTLGFVNFLAEPFFRDCTARLTGSEQMFENLSSNKSRWERRNRRHKKNKEQSAPV